MSQKKQDTTLIELEKIVDSFVQIQHYLVTEYSKEKDPTIRKKIKEDMVQISNISQETIDLWEQKKKSR